MYAYWMYCVVQIKECLWMVMCGGKQAVTIVTTTVQHKVSS